MNQKQKNKMLIDGIRKSDLDAVVRAFKLGADANAKDAYFTPVLSTACIYGNTVIIKLLLDYRTDVNALDENGRTPLMCAAVWGNTDAITLLVDAGADIDIKTNRGLTALDILKRDWPEKYSQWISKRQRKELLEQEDTVGTNSYCCDPDFAI